MILGKNIVALTAYLPVNWWQLFQLLVPNYFLDKVKFHYVFVATLSFIGLHGCKDVEI